MIEHTPYKKENDAGKRSVAKYRQRTEKQTNKSLFRQTEHLAKSQDPSMRDTLSKTPLVYSALDEPQKLARLQNSHLARLTDLTLDFTAKHDTELAQLAEGGGLDMRDFWGYSSQSTGTIRQNTGSRRATKKQDWFYGGAFDLILTESGIRPVNAI